MGLPFVRLDKILTFLSSILTPSLSPHCYPEIMKNIMMKGSAIMKAYLFNAENGLYEGETFENADKLHYEEGITPVPPPDYGHGQVPVFDRRKKDWAVIPVTIAKQLLYLKDDERHGE
jgi:hypothetical protein